MQIAYQKGLQKVVSNTTLNTNPNTIKFQLPTWKYGHFDGGKGV
jgi:hypothetical protein